MYITIMLVRLIIEGLTSIEVVKETMAMLSPMEQNIQVCTAIDAEGARMTYAFNVKMSEEDKDTLNRTLDSMLSTGDIASYEKWLAKPEV